MSEPPGWDDRKALHDVWQRYLPVPSDPAIQWSRDDFSRALIAVARWGYDFRKEEEEEQR